MHFVSGTVHFVSGTVKTPQYPAYKNLYSLYYRDLFVHQQKRATLACDHPPWSATGVPGKGWLRRFRLRYPEIVTKKSQRLEIARARAVCPTVAKSLYGNLEELYTTFQYPPSHI